MIFAIVLIVGVVAILYAIHKRQRRTFSPNCPIVDTCIPVIGNSLLVLRYQWKMLDMILEQAKLHNFKTFQFKVIGHPTFIAILDPANVEHVLSKNFDNYIKGDYFRDRFVDLLGDGIFDVDGEQWAMQRKTASHIFTRNELRGFMTDVFRDHAQLALEQLDSHATSGKPIDLQDLFYRYTLESIGKIAFGVNLGCFEKDEVEFATAFDTAQRILMDRALSPAWVFRRIFKWLHPDERKLTVCIKKLNEFAESLIRERRLEPDLDRKEDLLSRFMAFRDADGQPLSDTHLRDVVMSFVIAGRDTTANALSWLFTELTLHPECMDKLVAEVDTVLQGNLPTYENVDSEMPYLTGCLKEALRLHPSVPKDLKLAVKDDTLPDGTIIPAGAAAVYLPWAMGHMDQLWPNANEFMPERWNSNEQVSQYKYPVFNAGPRLCLGMNMAYVEAKIITACILQRFTVSRLPGQSTMYAVTLTLPLLDGLFCTIKRRED